MRLLAYLTVLVTLLCAAPVLAVQALDHCPSCGKVQTLDPKPSETCPNLMSWEEEKIFVRHWDDKLGGRNFKRLTPNQQITKFLTLFKEMTKDFATSIASETNPALQPVRDRLLQTVGWARPESWAQVENLVKKDPAIKMAAQNLVCDVVGARKARSDCDGEISMLNESERQVFLRRFESAVLDFVSEGVSLEEIVRAKVIPTEGARTRLLVALMEHSEMPTTLIFAIPKGDLRQACETKVPNPVRFTLFTVLSGEGNESVTLVNDTKEGETAIQTFPALGDWISFTSSLPNPERTTASIKTSLPTCFLNASQVHDFACDIWRKQK